MSELPVARLYDTPGGRRFRCIQGDLLNNHVLDYLYSFFLDEPAYNEAVKATLPSDNDRKALTKDIKAAEKRLAAVGKEVGNLVDAIAARADVGLLLDKQCVGSAGIGQLLSSAKRVNRWIDFECGIVTLAMAFVKSPGSRSQGSRRFAGCYADG